MRVLLLLVFVWGVGAEIGHNMNDLSQRLQQDMADVLDMTTVNYSEPVIVAKYHASADFDMRAMGPLYNSTHMVLDLIVTKEPYPEGIVHISDGHLEFEPIEDNWRTLVTHYGGAVALIVIGLLIAVVMPLAGLFWCCCYWCRVGRRRRPFDRKYDACLKGLLAIILIGLLTLFLFGVVCLFATEAQVEQGVREAGGGVRTALSDAREFINATQAHARHLLVDNYNELAERLNSLLQTSGSMVSMKLTLFSRAVSVTTLSQLVDKLDDVQAGLRDVQQRTASLRTRADDLNAGIRKIRTQLLQTLNNCNQSKCIALQNKYQIGRLDTEIRYSQIPDVSELLNNVTQLLEGNIKEEVGAGRKVFLDIQAAIRRSVQEHIPIVKEAILDAGKRLVRVADDITRESEKASARLGSVRAGDTLDGVYDEYGLYRRAAGLGAAAAPLLITCMVAWGLVCGVCGKRPDVYGASDCCNKGQGSKCLLCGVCVMFLAGGVAALFVVVYFVFGAAAQRLVCDPLTEPRGNRMFGEMEKFVDLEWELYRERTDTNFNLTSVLVNCHQNKTVYETLQMWRRYNLSLERERALQAVAARVGALRPSFPATTTILRAAARRQLAALAGAGLSEFEFGRILHALDTNLTSLALDDLADQLDAAAQALQRPRTAKEAGDLLRAANALRDLHAHVVKPMQADTDRLNATATRLRDEMRFNHSSLKEAINYLMHEATEAEHFLNHQGPERLQNLTRQFAEVVELRVSQYLDRVVDGAEHNVGRCGPLSNAFNATRDSACNKILMATNGYWMAMAWCLILFPPLMCVCVRLARLYLHVDVYPGPLVEAEYLYDAYADRDNVPLANAYKAEKRGGRRGREREGEAPGAGGAPPAAPPRDAHARRYNDMAPKHWEEGPPRYHGPTEYERPPPYYYPGPTDRQ